jgi:hypothetical protein
LIKVEHLDQIERFLDKISQLEPLSFNGFCNDGFGLGGFYLLGDKDMHSSSSNFEGTIYSH